MDLKMNQVHEPCEIKQEGKLYKIGMFAGINHVTIKALRYYDEQNLLKPAKVDEESGYRYYGAAQIADLHRILALRNMGFSTSDIHEIINSSDDKKMLLRKKQEILRKIAEYTEKLAMVESYLSKENTSLNAPVLIKKLPEVTVCAMKSTMESYDALFDLMPEMGGEMERLGCCCAEPDYCFTQFPDKGNQEEVSIEICQAVTEKKEDTDKVAFKVLPAVHEAACIFHRGSYDTFGESFAILLEYIEENGYEICGDIREAYIDGVWNKDTEEEWLSELQVPVKRINS